MLFECMSGDEGEGFGIATAKGGYLDRGFVVKSEIFGSQLGI